MPILLFRRDVTKRQNAADLEAQIAALGAAAVTEKRESVEEGKADVVFVDPDLPFTAADLADDVSFGNGSSVQGWRLKGLNPDGTHRWTEICYAMCVPAANVNAVRGMATAIKAVLNTRVSPKLAKDV